MRADWSTLQEFMARRDLNPVVVKELRQAVRSFFVSGVLLIFLYSLLFFMLAFMASHSAAPPTNQGLGSEALFILMAILAAVTLVFIPAYTGVRIALERQEGNVDLLYTTTLSPARIIRGKLYSGLCLAVLFCSACMPFILLTVFLRGVDLLTIGMTLYYLFGLVLLLVQTAILIACLPVSLLFKALIILPVAGAMISMVPSLSRTIQLMAQGGVAPSLLFFVNSTLAGLLIWGWLYVCSIGLISPKSMNRAFSIRLYSMFIWCVSGLFSFYYAYRHSISDPLQSWMGFSIFLCVMMLLFSVGESDLLSLRVQSQIPQNRAWRFLAFFFFNGAAQGIAWCLLVTGAITPLLLLVSLSGWHPWISPAQSDYSLMAALAYSYCYILTGIFIHRRFLPNRPPIHASVIAILIPLLFATLPALILFFINRLSWQVMESLQLGNVFNLSLAKDVHHSKIHFFFALSWALLALAVNLPWFFRQVRAFRPPLQRTQETEMRRSLLHYS